MMAGVDVASLLKQVWDAIRQIRSDITALQQGQERPAASSGLAANRPTSSLRVGQQYFSTDTGANEYWTGTAWAAIGTGGGGSGITSLAVTAPVTKTGPTATPTLGLAVSVANDGGAIVKNPASAQSANINVTGPVSINGVPQLDRGNTFPSAALVDGQRYFHTVYRAWFTYNSTDNLWRQEAPGVFTSTFPTVAPVDNTAAPQIQITRFDRGITYFWDGARWLSVQRYAITLDSRASQPTTAAAGTTSNLSFYGQTMPDFGVTGWNGIYVDSFAFNFFSTVAQSASNYYTVRLYNVVGGTIANFSLTNSNTQNATTVTQWTPRVVTITPAVVASNVAYIEAAVDQTGAPGNFTLYCTVGYRRIG